MHRTPANGAYGSTNSHATGYPNTFNSDYSITVATRNAPEIIKRMHGIASFLKKESAQSSSYKITSNAYENGTTIIKIRAYSTKSWDDAATKLAAFTSKNVYRPIYKFGCEHDIMYNTLIEFVRSGRSDQQETVFSQKFFEYIISVNRDTGDTEIIHMPTVKNTGIEHETKFTEFCKKFVDALVHLSKLGDIKDIIRRIDPAIIAMEHQVAAKKQHFAAKPQIPDTPKKQTAAAYGKQSVVNRFATLTVDDSKNTEQSSASASASASWASLVTTDSTPQSRGRRTSTGSKPNIRHCRYGVSCYRADCGFLHPAERTLPRYVEEEDVRIPEQPIFAPKKYEKDFPPVQPSNSKTGKPAWSDY